MVLEKCRVFSMNKKQTRGFINKRRWAVFRLLLFVFVMLYCLAIGQLFLALGVVLLAYVINEIFYADHIFYDPNADYLYKFENAVSYKPLWSDDGRAFELNADAGRFDTAFLAIRIECTLRGKLLDPFVTIKSADTERQQYFERSVNGLRYINISEFVHSGEAIFIEPLGCGLEHDSTEVLLFSNPSLKDKKVLVIAPHADDAEIAAFGLYSTHNSNIVTITAGEIEAQEYEAQSANSEDASLLKGRLRSWDSIAVPLWAGLTQQDTIQLGYFCMQLKAMHGSPSENIMSQASGVSDTRVFREFNKQSLNSDAHGSPNWNTLVGDLVELIEQIQPDCIVTPHPELDPHQDHHYSTVAVKEALLKTKHKPKDIYLFTNHLVYSDMFPFGPAHTLASLPPNMDNAQSVESLVSIPLTTTCQKDKATALAMMHDLQTPLRWKKKLRFQLQAWLIGRRLSPYGEDEYFRKAVRSNELFFLLKTEIFLKKY